MRKSNERAILAGHTGSSRFRKIIEKNSHEYLFQVSDEFKFSRLEAATKYQIVNFVAVRLLERALKALRIKTVRQLAEVDPGSLLRAEDVGFTTLLVAMNILDYHGFDIADWWGWGKEDKQRQARKHKQPIADESVAAHA